MKVWHIENSTIVYWNDENSCICFDPGGRSIVAGNSYGRVEKFDFVLGETTWRKSFQAEITTIAMSDDAMFLAVGTPQQIMVWSMADSTTYARLEGHGGMVRSVAFYPMSHWIISTGEGAVQSVKSWDIHSEDPELSSLIGHWVSTYFWCVRC